MNPVRYNVLIPNMISRLPNIIENHKLAAGLSNGVKYLKYIFTIAPLLALLFVADAAHATSHVKLENPLAVEGVADFVALVLKVLVMVALPIISFFIVYSGFLFLTAQGKPENLSKAKENLVYVLIGATLILGAWVIATLIGGTVSQIIRP